MFFMYIEMKAIGNTQVFIKNVHYENKIFNVDLLNNCVLFINEASKIMFIVYIDYTRMTQNKIISLR